jgi:hypothetical protein
LALGRMLKIVLFPREPWLFLQPSQSTSY